MSSPIWTRVALSSEFQGLSGPCWRLVEAQHRASTMKLVDTLDDQEILEDLIEATKPVLPTECRALDYLLAAPFRYDTIYPKGSRFRRAGRTPGVYYGAEAVETAVAEIAWYRRLFFMESPDTPWPENPAEYTAFSVEILTEKALDLTVGTLAGDVGVWTHKDDYEGCQAFADAARAAGAEVIRYQSVRAEGINLAIMSCTVFKGGVGERQTWRIRPTAAGALAVCEFPRLSLEIRWVGG